MIRLEHTVLPCYSEKLERISHYTQEMITAKRFRRSTTWTDLKNILLYHPNALGEYFFYAFKEIFSFFNAAEEFVKVHEEKFF